MEVLSFFGDQGRFVVTPEKVKSHVIGFANGFDISGINEKIPFLSPFYFYNIFSMIPFLH